MRNQIAVSSVRTDRLVDGSVPWTHPRHCDGVPLPEQRTIAVTFFNLSGKVMCEETIPGRNPDNRAMSDAVIGLRRSKAKMCGAGLVWVYVIQEQP